MASTPVGTEKIIPLRRNPCRVARLPCLLACQPSRRLPLFLQWPAADWTGRRCCNPDFIQAREHADLLKTETVAPRLPDKGLGEITSGAPTPIQDYCGLTSDVGRVGLSD